MSALLALAKVWKIMRKSFYLVMLLLSLCGFAGAQEKTAASGNSGIIYGENHVYTLTAPKGWTLDNASGKSQGLQAVFYPAGSSWQQSAAVMYGNVYHKRDLTQESVETVIAGDIAEFKKSAADLKVTDADPLPTAKDEKLKDKKATVKYFSADANGQHDAVGYINESKVVVMIVLTARSKKDFDAALPAFKELVGSYFFLGDKVTLEK